MPRKKLTPKQEAFRIAYLDKKNGREAYKIAYEAEGMSDGAIDKEVRNLLKNPILGPLITRGLERQVERIQIQADLKGLLSIEEHDKNLVKIQEAATADGKHEVALKAEVKRGELRKYYVKQVEVGDVGDFDKMSDEELDKYLTETDEEIKSFIH